MNCRAKFVGSATAGGDVTLDCELPAGHRMPHATTLFGLWGNATAKWTTPEDANSASPDALRVACPRCKAAPGDGCSTRNGRLTAPHSARDRAAR